jgi:hypothetical protein
LDKVCDRIKAREIWLPYGEIKTHVCEIIAKTARKQGNQGNESEQSAFMTNSAE